MALRHAIDHGKSESCAALTLGCEERLNAAAARLLCHTDACVTDLHPGAIRDVCCRIGAPIAQARTQREDTASGHRIDGVHHQIRQSIPDLVFGTKDLRQSECQLSPQFDDKSVLLRHVAPADPCEFGDVREHRVEIHRHERKLWLAGAVELAQARDRAGDTFDRTLNHHQVAARLLTE